MRKLILMLTVAMILVLAACSSTFEPDKENVDIERAFADIEESNEVMEEMEKDGFEKFEYDDNKEIGISLKEFLYNYYEIAEEKDLVFIDSGSVLDKPSYDYMNFGTLPTFGIEFHYDDKGNHMIRSISCWDKCDDEHQDAMIEALRLEDFKYDKDYVIEEGYEEREDGSRYDYYRVNGK